jgi:hypothetical protein
MRQKLVLALDSHALSTYQRCGQEFDFSYIQHLENAQPVSYYDKGSLVHLLLALYYRLRRRGFSIDKAAMIICTKRFKRYAKKFSLTYEEEQFILSRFFEYVGHYKAEMLTPVGIETGFSEKIYEDKHFIFIYEGRIDLTAVSSIERAGRVLHFVDHKTRSQAYEIDNFKNQFFGYAWMMKKLYGPDYDGWGCVNYFGLQEDKTKSIAKSGKLFEKVWFNVTEDQIKQWERDTIWWFHKISQSKMYRIFPRSWQCDRKFGECEYKRICLQPTKELKKLISIDGVYYKKRQKEWSAWN